MLEKQYCFIPEPYKIVSVYNPKSITDFTAINNTDPSCSFKYYIDSIDPAKIFYLDGKQSSSSENLLEYFKYKIILSIKSIFKVTELSNFELFLDDFPRAEFTLYFDMNGNEIKLSHLVETNKNNTVVAHHYIYNFYKKGIS